MEKVEVIDILDEKIMGVQLLAETKREAIYELALLLFESGYISEIDSFIEDIYYRESLGKTGIGNFIVIPHGQSESVNKNGIAIGSFNAAIPWETLDDKPVHVVCLFCVRSGDGGEKEHLRMLAALAGKLGNEETVKALLEANSVEAIKAAFL